MLPRNFARNKSSNWLATEGSLWLIRLPQFGARWRLTPQIKMLQRGTGGALAGEVMADVIAKSFMVKPNQLNREEKESYLL